MSVPAVTQPAYGLRGSFFELCDCYTICPCWVGEPPSDGRCTGAFGWAIAEGRIGEVDVAGVDVVSVSFHAGHRDNGGQEVYVFIDEAATDEQYHAVLEAFTGKSGGPLGELGTLMGTLLGHERAPIELRADGRHLSVTVGRVVAGDGEILEGADGEITELHHGRLSEVLGPKAEVGRTALFGINLGGSGLTVEVNGRAAMRGTFDYSSDGAPG